MGDSWSIVELTFSATTARAYEGLFTLGSGYLHVRGSLEEHLNNAPQNATYDRKPANVTAEEFPDVRARWGTYVPGLFAKHPLMGNEMVNLPFFLGLVPFVDDEKLDMETSRVMAYRRELLLRSATLRRSLEWVTRRGDVVQVAFERFISAARPGLCVQRLTLGSCKEVAVTVRAGIDADVRTCGFDHFVHVAVAPVDETTLECRLLTDGGDDVHIISSLTGSGTSWSFEGGGRTGCLAADLVIPPGDRLVVEKRTVVGTGRDLRPEDPFATLTQAKSLSYDTLWAEHAAVWEDRWKRADVIVEGDEISQLALRASIYHLLRCHVAGDDRVSIDPKGYSGEAYCGRYFWDTEMYILPFYLYTDPDRAKTLVDFRLHTLSGARANASRYGYAGARYAWESDDSGRECCPDANWQYSDHEVHVTADVVYGLAHFARATGDLGYLRGLAAAAIVETARYWLERMDWRPGDDHPSLLGVMGPDEYTPICNNNSYTNRLVSFALSTAAEVGAAGGASPAECEAFALAAAKLPIPRRADGLVLQCEGFDQLAEPRFDELWLDRKRPFAAQVSQERLYRSKCIKQADVLLLMALFPQEFGEQEVRQAWDYYVPCTTHDSSLSAGVHVLIALRLGLVRDAWEFWRFSTGTDLDLSRGGASEGVHIAAAAANWQAAIFGFAGMASAMQADLLTLRPKLPVAWSRLAFPIVWRSCPAFVDIRDTGCTVSNLGATQLEVCVGRQRCAIPAGQSVTFALSEMDG